VPLVPIPAIDLTPYYNAALANGQVLTSTGHWSAVPRHELGRVPALVATT
jgi:hypothetical protein